MNTNLTEIAFILDRSGSMQSCSEATITGFNEFLREQQSVAGDARFTLALFNRGYDVACASVPICEVVELDDETFVPAGMTALLDAIGRTIDELGARLAALPEAERPGLVVVAILTDGMENASQKFTHSAVARKIAHQTEVYGWTFLFLGANQDAIATAARLSIAAHDSADFVADGPGFSASMRVLSRKTRSKRTMMMGEMTAEEARALLSSMSELAAEEDRKAREGK